MSISKRSPWSRWITWGMAFTIALLCAGVSVASAAAPSGGVISEEVYGTLPRLPGGLVLGGVAGESADHGWSQFEPVSPSSEVPDALEALLEHVAAERLTDEWEIERGAWRAEMSGEDAGTTVLVESFTTSVDHASSQFVALRVSVEGRGDSEVPVRLLVESALLADDGNVAGVMPARGEAIRGAVALTVAPESSGLNAVLAVGDPVVVGAGEAARELATLVLDAQAGETTLVGALTDLWGTTPAVQLGDSLVSTGAGEPARGRIVTLSGTDRQNVGPGDRLTYTLRMGNVGAASATEIATNLPVPRQVAIDAESLRVNSGDAEWDAESGSIAWAIGRVPVGGVVELSYEAVVR